MGGGAKMKKDLVTLMDENRRSLGRSRGSRLMEITPEDREPEVEPEDEDENPGGPILEEDLEVEV
jgi:hypothetical protein